MNGKTYPINEDTDLKAILIKCVERRCRTPHRRFIGEELRLGPENIVPINRAGGAGPLRLGKRGIKKIPKDIIKQIKIFLKRHPEIERIILIHHEDCRRFDVLKKKDKSNDLERRHLVEAVRVLTKKYPDKKIEGYFGRFTGPSLRRVTFDSIS